MSNYGIIIHPEDIGELLGMSPAECGSIVQNMCRTFNGEEAVRFDDRYLDFVSSTLCGHLERDLKKSKIQSENGKKGGGQFGNSNAKRTKNEPKTSEERAKTNPKPKPKPKPNPNPNKGQYGELRNVLLTDEEYSKLEDKGYVDLIDELSLYIASNGKGDKYKNHYATICQWANKRKKEKESGTVKQFKPTSNAGENSSNPFNRFTQRDINFDEVAARLIKN